MATDLERLVVSLDADIKKFDASLRKAVATFNGEAKKIETRAKTMAGSVNSSFADFGKAFAIGGVTAGLTAGIMAFKDLADGATRTQNALKVAGLSGQELTDVYQQLFAAAQANAVPIEALVQLYGRASLSQKDLGASTARMITFSDNVAKALRVSGTSAEQAQGALMQLSQALAAGTVRAEEFNSIQEGALPILQTVAAGIDKTGGSVAELRKLVLAGQLSSKQFFDAFERGAGILDAKLAGSVLTVDQALVKMRNSLQDAVGQIDSATGISSKTVEIIGRLATAVDNLGTAFTSVANSDVGAFIGKLNELQSEINPLYRAIEGLEDGVNSLGNALAEPTAIEKTVDAAEKLAHALETSVPRGLVTAEQKRQLDELAAGLRDGTKSADEVDTALFGLGSRFDKLREQLQPLIAQLREMKELVMDEITIAGPRSTPSEGALQAQYDAKESAFINQRNAEAMKNDLERNVETRAKAIIDAANKIGLAMTEAEAKIQARSEIATEAGVKSFEGAISGYVDRVISVESGGNTNAKNPDSTATGLGQFIESTWLDLFRRYYPAEAANMSTSAILALRTDAAKSKVLIEAYARENAAVLQKAGVSVTEASLQLAHFLGPSDAAKVFNAAPGTPLKGLISSSSIAANPTILGGGRTVDDAIAYAQKRAGMTTSGTQAIDNRESFSQKIAEQERMLAQLKEETGIRASLNPLINDHGQKLTELEKAQELFNLAQQEGTAAGKELTSATQLLTGDLSGLTPEARAQAEAMRALAQQYGVTTAAANQLKDSQEAAAKSSTESLELAKSVTGGILSDIRSALADGKITWKEWGQIAVNALNKVADKLQEMLLNQLLSPTGGGGLFGSLFGGGGFNLATATPGLFSEGGFTGTGGKFQPAGIVHKGEYVFDQDTVRRLGVANLQALHRGYANGGLVGAAPRLPNIGGMGRSGPIELSLKHYVDEDGNWQAKVERISGAVAVKVNKATGEAYRSGKMKDDVRNAVSNPRRLGTA